MSRRHPGDAKEQGTNQHHQSRDRHERVEGFPPMDGCVLHDNHACGRQSRCILNIESTRRHRRLTRPQTDHRVALF